MNIIEIVKDLLRTEYSGGAKFLELISHLTLENHISSVADMSELLESLRADPDVGVLTYYWPLGAVNREKYFIYFSSGARVTLKPGNSIE